MIWSTHHDKPKCCQTPVDLTSLEVLIGKDNVTDDVSGDRHHVTEEEGADKPVVTQAVPFPDAIGQVFRPQAEAKEGPDGKPVMFCCEAADLIYKQGPARAVWKCIRDFWSRICHN